MADYRYRAEGVLSWPGALSRSVLQQLRQALSLSLNVSLDEVSTVAAPTPAPTPTAGGLRPAHPSSRLFLANILNVLVCNLAEINVVF